MEENVSLSLDKIKYTELLSQLGNQPLESIITSLLE